MKRKTSGFRASASRSPESPESFDGAAASSAYYAPRKSSFGAIVIALVLIGLLALWFYVSSIAPAPQATVAAAPANPADSLPLFVAVVFGLFLACFAVALRFAYRPY